MSVFKEDILKGKTVLVTGGGTGIGFGICTSLGLHGANVALASRKQDVIDEAVSKLKAKGINAYGLTLDVRNEQNCYQVVDKVVERFGKIDFLVNNAAGNFMTSIENLSSNGLKTVLEIDLMGCFNMSKAALPYMKKNNFGVIVNISATLHYRVTPFQFHASAAKAGVDALTNSIGIEWGEYGIRAVGVAPGPIGETAGGPGGRVFGIKDADNDMISKMMPLGRYGKIEDIADTVLFLVSPAGEFINATTIVVDGGHWHGAVPHYKALKKVIVEKSKDEKKNFKGGIAKSKL